MINKIADVDFVNGASDFRLMKRTMVDAILNMSEYHRFSKGIFSWVGFNTKYIPYTVAEREFGESKWNFIKLLKYAVDGIISFSTFPLKFVTAIGLITSFASVVYLIAVIIQKLCSRLRNNSSACSVPRGNTTFLLRAFRRISFKNLCSG